MKENKTYKVSLKDIYREVAQTTNVSITDSRIVCESFLGILIERLRNFEKVTLSGYFSLEPTVHKSRPVVQWGTNKVVVSCEAPQIKFIPCKQLKQSLRESWKTKKAQLTAIATDDDNEEEDE